MCFGYVICKTVVVCVVTCIEEPLEIISLLLGMGQYKKYVDQEATSVKLFQLRDSEKKMCFSTTLNQIS